MAIHNIRVEVSAQAAIRGLDRAHDEAVYIIGFIDGVERIKKRNRELQEMRRRKRYFIKQRFFGLAALMIAALSARVLDGDATVALVMVPLGLSLITSRQMLIINKYYWEHEDRTGGGKDAFYHQ